MRVISLLQGSKEWHEHRANHLNASDAPAMMGMSLYKSRNDLLKEYKTGLTPGVDVHLQRIFEKGHEYEKLARVIIEKQIDEELYPVTGVIDAEKSSLYDGLALSASFDGINLNEDLCFEHKSLNEILAAVQDIDNLPMQNKIQMQQQLMVAECDECLFVASNGTEEGMKQFLYKSDKKLEKEIVAGWNQFLKDLETFVVEPEEVKPETKAIMELPALAISIKGEVSSSNLELYKKTAMQFIDGINTELQTDEDFANAEVTIKFCDSAEKELEAVKKQALAQTSDIDLLFKTVDHLKEEMRSKRLTLNKLVKTQKDSIKIQIINEAKDKINEHVVSLNKEMKGVVIPHAIHDFSDELKGKRNLSSMRDAVDEKIASLKIGASQIAQLMRVNVEYLESYKDYKFLFNDLQQIAWKPNDDFKNLVDSRISQHKEAEKKRLEVEREKIRKEEEAKLIAAKEESKAESKKEEGKPEPRAERVIEVEDTPELMAEIDKQRRWISESLKQDCFTKKHIETIAYIVGLFKDCPESEKDVFDFSYKLFK
jgi:putative phage-type endonuclease